MPAALYVWFFVHDEIKWSRQQTSSICFGLAVKWSNVFTAATDGRSRGPKRRADKNDWYSGAPNFTLLPLDAAQGFMITGTPPTSKCSGTAGQLINLSRLWKRRLFTCIITGLSLLGRERFPPGFGTPPSAWGLSRGLPDLLEREGRSAARLRHCTLGHRILG